MKTARLGLIGPIIITCCANIGSAQPIIAESYFESGAEGWTAIRTTAAPFDPSTLVPTKFLTWIATDGNPDGYFQHVDAGDGVYSYWSAPSTFLGNKSAAYGGVLSYDLTQSENGPIARLDVVLQGGGLTLVFDTPYNPKRDRWTRYHLLLAPGAGWQVTDFNGPAATQEQLQQSLAAVTGLFIRAEFSNALDIDGIDNVVLTGPSSSCPSSEFDTDAEGWWTLEDADTVEWLPSSGNPGGCLAVTDLATNSYWRYLAPAEFLGDRTFLLDSIMEFDLLASPVGMPDPAPEVPILRIRGGGTTLSFDAASIPVNGVWTHFVVPLTPSAAWTRSSDGQVATAQDFATVFGAVSELSIRGEYSVAIDQGSLDNVVFLVCRPCKLIGDFDQNELVDEFDIDTMTNVLLGIDIDPGHLLCADFNGDDFANGSDIEGFVASFLGN